MKQAIKKTKMAAVTIATAVSFAFTPAHAIPMVENPVKVTYLGTSNSQPVFLLDLGNKEGVEYNVVIKDASNKVLYRETTKSEASRKYKLDIEEDVFHSPGFNLTFEVTPSDTKKTQVFNVSTQQRLVQDVIIAINE